MSASPPDGDVRSLIEDCTVDPRELAGSLPHLLAFLARYQPLMARREQRGHLRVYVEGLVSDLERKTAEPIATAHHLKRRPVQTFVGAGRWDDDAVLAEMRRHVAEEIGEPDGVLVMDGSGFPKKGPESVGVGRQWCGRLGKVENCQVGVFLAYSSSKGYALVDRRLYLPAQWAADPERRAKTYVPAEEGYQTTWQLAAAMIDECGPVLPYRWITGDDEFGRPTEFRDGLRILCRRAGTHYLLEVPSNTRVRRRRKTGKSPWMSAARRAKLCPAERWQRCRLRDGERGPVDVRVLVRPVETYREGAPPVVETLVVVVSLHDGRTWYYLTDASHRLPAAQLAQAAAHRHHIEEAFGAAKGEAGMAHYEVRSWVGWHHHMTLTLLASWFLTLEKRRLGKKSAGDHGPAGTPSDGDPAGAAAL